MLLSCANVPPEGWADSPKGLEQREIFFHRLVHMQPEAARTNRDLQDEAHWLADTTYKAGAAIGRYNNPKLASWLHNLLVNSRHNLAERGLCWHWQHDLYRELRRRPLRYYRLGCCVLNKGTGSEHHCVYISPRANRFSEKESIVFDAWWNSGKIKVWHPDVLVERECQEEPDMALYLDRAYPEGHTLPLEHWARVKSDTGYKQYLNSYDADGAASRQGKLMQQRMTEGMRRRNGKPIDY